MTNSFTLVTYVTCTQFKSELIEQDQTQGMNIVKTENWILTNHFLDAHFKGPIHKNPAIHLK